MSQTIRTIFCFLHRTQNKFVECIFEWISFKLFQYISVIKCSNLIRYIYIYANTTQIINNTLQFFFGWFFVDTICKRYIFVAIMFCHYFICKNHKIFDKFVCVVSFAFFYINNFVAFHNKFAFGYVKIYFTIFLSVLLYFF